MTRRKEREKWDFNCQPQTRQPESKSQRYEAVKVKGMSVSVLLTDVCAGIGTFLSRLIIVVELDVNHSLCLPV